MARYKPIDTSPRFLAVDLERQLLPGHRQFAAVLILPCNTSSVRRRCQLFWGKVKVRWNDRLGRSDRSHYWTPIFPAYPKYFIA